MKKYSFHGWNWMSWMTKGWIWNQNRIVALDSCTIWGCISLIGTFSTGRHFLRIPIKNVVSLDRTLGVSMPMTSILTLYLWPFHLRKHLKEPIGAINQLSKFCNKKVDFSNSTSGNRLSKVFLLIAFKSGPVSAIRVNFLSKERGVKPQPNSMKTGLSVEFLPDRTFICFSWYSFRRPFSSKKSAFRAVSLNADAIFILPVELEFCGLECDFCGKLPDFLQAIL